MPGGVNLIPQAKLVARKRVRRVRAWCVAGSIYAGALGVAWASVHLLGRDEHTALAAEIEALQEQIDQDNEAALALRPRLDAALATLAANRSVGSQPDWSLLLSLVADMLGDEVVLSACELEDGAPPGPFTADAPGANKEASGASVDHDVLRRYTLRLVGLGKSHGAVLGYVRTLEKTQLFESVKLVETRPEPFGDTSAIGFKIECLLADRAKEAE